MIITESTQRVVLKLLDYNAHYECFTLWCSVVSLFLVQACNKLRSHWDFHYGNKKYGDWK